MANVGARTSVICQNEKNDANKQNGKTNPDQTNTDTDTANNGSKGKGFNYLDFLQIPKYFWSVQTFCAR